MTILHISCFSISKFSFKREHNLQIKLSLKYQLHYNIVVSLKTLVSYIAYTDYTIHSNFNKVIPNIQTKENLINCNKKLPMSI